MQFSSRDEWLQYRKGKIGSSDAPILHGASPWGTPHSLWTLKTADKFVEDDSNSFVKERGNAYEVIARKKLAALHKIENGTEETFEPKVMEMLELPFMSASLDGCSIDGKIIAEFKFMSEPIDLEKGRLTEGQQKHLNVLDSSLPITCSDGGQCRVPFIYWLQIQHQLLVSGAEKCIFASFDGESLHTCDVYPDTKFMEIHINKCVDFWTLVLQRTPPNFVDADFKKIKGKGLTAAVRSGDTNFLFEIAEASGSLRCMFNGMKIMKEDGIWAVKK